MRLRLFSRVRRAAMRALGRDGQRPARQDPAPRRAPSGQVGSHRRTAMPPVTKRDDSKPGFPVAGGSTRAAHPIRLVRAARLRQRSDARRRDRKWQRARTWRRGHV